MFGNGKCGVRLKSANRVAISGGAARLSVLTFALVFSALLGCGDSTAVDPPVVDEAAVSSDTGGQQPTAAVPPVVDEPAVELSDVVVTLEGEALVRYSVKYRFTKAPPQAGQWYTLAIQFEGGPGAAIRVYRGAELSTEGTIAVDTRRSKPGATAYSLYLQRAPNEGGPYRTISNTPSGPVNEQ